MPSSQRSGSRGARPGRPRREETGHAIHAAALRLLRAGGPGAVTVEAIAQEAGVAKTTVYRRHADSRAALSSALKAAIVPPSEPQGETPRDKIRWALEQIWRQMSGVLGRGGVAALVSNTDPEFSALARRTLKPYTSALANLISADIAAGELRPDLDAETVVSVLLGAYLGEAVRRGRLSKGFVDACVDLLWVAMTPGGAAR